MIEEILSAAKFRFEAKIQRKSALCSNEMSLKRPRTFDRIFARTFDERSLEQITKFAEFRLHYFCTILYIDRNVLIFLFLCGIYSVHANIIIYLSVGESGRYLPSCFAARLISPAISPPLC